MMNPVGCDVDDVDVLAFAHFLVCIYTATVSHSSMSSVLIKPLLAKFYAVGLYVTERHDVRSRDLAPSFYCTDSAHSQPNKAHANRLQLRRSELQHVLLSGRTLGYVGLYDLDVLRIYMS